MSEYEGKWMPKEYVMPPKKFQKFDQDKDPWSKFPWRAARAVMTIMKHGAHKYGWGNWRQAEGKDVTRYLDATLRHLIAVIEGKHFDPDSQLSAAHHALCSLMFYVDCVERDREKRSMPQWIDTDVP